MLVPNSLFCLQNFQISTRQNVLKNCHVLSLNVFDLKEEGKRKEKKLKKECKDRREKNRKRET